MDENQPAQVLSLQIAEGGIELMATFASDDRKDLSMARSFLISFEHEEFGPDARELVDRLQDFAWEIERNYKRQPREGQEED